MIIKVVLTVEVYILKSVGKHEGFWFNATQNFAHFNEALLCKTLGIVA